MSSGRRKSALSSSDRPVAPRGAAAAVWLLCLALIVGSALRPSGSPDWGRGVALGQQARGGEPPSGAGRVPEGPYVRLTTLEIRNDTSVERSNEIAFSAVPVAREANLTQLDHLAVVSAGGRLVPAQMSVLSRWGGTVDDGSKPIRWVQVVVKTDVAGHATTEYELRQYAAPPPRVAGDDVRVTQSGSSYTIDTGVATFELDPASPALLRAIVRRGAVVYRHAAGAGPRVIDAAGAPLVARVDAGGFAIEETGPVRVVARLRGHFASRDGGCGRDLSYAVRFTFERASSDVGIQFHVGNECGDGHSPAGQLAGGAPWWNRAYRINEISWSFSMPQSPDLQSLAGGGRAKPHRGQNLEGLKVEQDRGRAGAVYRSAHVLRGSAALEREEFFERPFVAATTRDYTALLQMPWMRFREPQALAVDRGVLTLSPVSRPATIGEAQEVWSFARLTIADGDATDAVLQQLRDRAHVALERGLLVHVPVSYLDSTGVMPPLSPQADASALHRRYVEALRKVHDDTVRPGGQWERQKLFGFAVWPDYAAGDEAVQVVEPSASSPGSNYWSATNAEFIQWFVDGDPKWVWDFALPQEYTQLFTNYYNLGTRNNAEAANYRGGFTAISGGRAIDGEVYRSGWGSDDYTYNQGSDEAYLIRPNRAMLDRFRDAADTVIRRYAPTNIPAAAQARRDEGLQALKIARGQAQHVNALRYAAQFADDGASTYVRALTSVMDEYVADNLRGGIFCSADYGNENACVGTWGLYHFVSLQLGTFMDFLNWVGPDDPRGAAIARALRTTAAMYAQVLMRPSAAGAIDPSAPWYGGLECTFTEGGQVLSGCRGRDTDEPVYAHERPAALSFVLTIARASGDAGMCAVAAAALPGALDGGLGYFTSGAGWNKGAAQSAHMIAHGLAALPCTRPSR